MEFRKKVTGTLQAANKCQLSKVISKFVWVISTQMAQTLRNSSSDINR